MQQQRAISADGHCRQPAGMFIPRIDRNRCEGKGPCVDVCPQHVLVIGTLTRAERANLSFVGKLKALAHGNQQAFIADAGACQACGDCVKSCPENAITLQRRTLDGASETGASR